MFVLEYDAVCNVSYSYKGSSRDYYDSLKLSQFSFVLAKITFIFKSYYSMSPAENNL